MAIQSMAPNRIPDSRGNSLENVPNLAEEVPDEVPPVLTALCTWDARTSDANTPSL